MSEEIKPSDGPREKFLIEQYKSLRDEIGRNAGFHTTAVRLMIVLVVASFGLITHPSGTDNKYWIYIGTILILLWICKLTLMLDKATWETGDFLTRIEKAILDQDAPDLGWQTFYKNRPETKCNRSSQNMFLIMPIVIYGVFAGIFIHWKSILIAMSRAVAG